MREERVERVGADPLAIIMCFIDFSCLFLYSNQVMGAMVVNEVCAYAPQTDCSEEEKHFGRI